MACLNQTESYYEKQLNLQKNHKLKERKELTHKAEMHPTIEARKYRAKGLTFRLQYGSLKSN